ncbi:hypothetical protein [Paraflavitalea speifideaquila]|nr:hypothetical protein [Paraflavitalea speifideiaquila]
MKLLYSLIGTLISSGALAQTVDSLDAIVVTAQKRKKNYRRSL